MIFLKDLHFPASAAFNYEHRRTQMIDVDFDGLALCNGRKRETRAEVGEESHEPA